MVHFTVGDGPDEPVRASSKEKSSGIVRSYSQHTDMLLAVEDKTTSSFLPKTSYSENSLDSSNQDRSGQQKVSPTTASTTSINSTTTTSTTSRKALKETQQIQSTVDDETLSTDSNSTADNDELKRRRRKILFAFKKNKTKVTL